MDLYQELAIFIKMYVFAKRKKFSEECFSTFQRFSNEVEKVCIFLGKLWSVTLLLFYLENISSNLAQKSTKRFAQKNKNSTTILFF